MSTDPAPTPKDAPKPDAVAASPPGTDGPAGPERRNLADHPIPLAPGWHLPAGVVVGLVVTALGGLAAILWNVALEPTLDRMVQKHVESKTDQAVAKSLAERSARIDRSLELTQAYASIVLVPKEQQDTEAPDTFRRMVKKYPAGFDVDFSDPFIMAGLQAIVNTPNPRAYEAEVQFAKTHYTKPSNAQFTHAMGSYNLRIGNLNEARTDLIASLRMFDSNRNPEIRGATLQQLAMLALIDGDAESAYKYFEDANAAGFKSGFAVSYLIVHKDSYPFFPVGFNWTDPKYQETKKALEAKLTPHLGPYDRVFQQLSEDAVKGSPPKPK
ncbi:MAG: hypothetical protein J2P46_07720 [Zavarzinella sp.]|nr:hypothetical protein [Zavarzinella sp.]